MRAMCIVLCSFLIVQCAKAQQHRFFLETGIVLGASDYPKGFDGVGEFTHSPSVIVGRITSISSQVDFSWGIRYSRFATADTIGIQQVGPVTVPFEPVRNLVQHYLSIPLHAHFKLNKTYVFVGPEVGVVARARYTFGRVIRDGRFVVGRETETIDARSFFSPFNAIITAGLGQSWKMWRSEGYVQLSYGHSLLPHVDRQGVKYRAGFGREFYLSTGIRL